MKRTLLENLLQWKDSPHDMRKPLILRGARQVGKSWLVREFAKTFDSFIEINFEKEKSKQKIFDGDLDPKRIIRDLTHIYKKEITENTLLFFDEIQECLPAIESLRYFHEETPAIPIVAAGSLLDFALEAKGIPVGRVTFRYLYPLTFKEFLDANGHQKHVELLEKSVNENAGINLSTTLHETLLTHLSEYLAVGGMPSAVNAWIKYKNLDRCKEVHEDLINTYRQDFNKYARKSAVPYVGLVFDNIPNLLAKKFVYSHVSKEHRSRELANALDLLKKAGIVHLISHTSANGLPLSAEENRSLFKAILLDIALAQTILGQDNSEWILNPEKAYINKGPIIEAYIGQELIAYSSPSSEAKLHYWVREKAGSMAELDYVISKKRKVIPIEVKSGSTGKEKSLKLFLNEKKNSPYGVFFSRSNFVAQKIKGENIINLPIYAVFAFCAIDFTYGT
ncbi:MAG: ATP-binding protein [Oligoflexia bacterium]|nr:ATP-binding protein [Oligoflexia bacterium]